MAPSRSAPGPDGPLPRGYVRGQGAALRQRPVWVDLAALYPAPPGPPGAVPDGLAVDGEVPGRLHYWARGSDGRWLAVVSFRLPYRVKRRDSPGLEIRWTPVPAATVRPAPEEPDGSPGPGRGGSGRAGSGQAG